MEKKSDYLIITNKSNNKTLVYYPTAKNANSSVKFFLIKHLGLENKFYNIDDQLPGYMQTDEILKKYKGKKNVINFLPPYTKFKKVIADEKCCLVRDPIARFVSNYKNRILFHRDSGFINHSIDMVIEKLENNMFENRHFLPQNYWLGKDLKYFNIVANTSNIINFVDGINDFSKKELTFPKSRQVAKNFKFH